MLAWQGWKSFSSGQWHWRSSCSSHQLWGQDNGGGRRRSGPFNFLLTLLQHRTRYKNKTCSFISPIMFPCLRHTAQTSVQTSFHTTASSTSPLPAARALCHRKDCWNQTHKATALLGKGDLRSNSFPQQIFPASKHRETKAVQITWPHLLKTGGR